MSSEDDEPRIEQAVKWISQAKKVIVFTGAGMSAASGIATFRDDDGFWKRFPPEEFANWKGLIQIAALQPKRMAEFLIAVLKPIAEATPNVAHQAIKSFEEFATVEVITQNIDGLHQDAKSNVVHEIHGSLFEIVSFPSGQRITTLTRKDLSRIVEKLETSQNAIWAGPKVLQAIAPLLGGRLGGFHRPNLVLFGDQLAEPDWTSANQAIQNCDLFFAIGTSQSVYPAASLPLVAKEKGAKVIVIDPVAGGGDMWFAEKAEEFLPRLMAAAKARGQLDGE